MKLSQALFKHILTLFEAKWKPVKKIELLSL